MEAALRRTFASFGVRNFRLYYLGQGISLCGTWMQTIAMSWLVLELTHSGTQLGLVLAAQYLPILIFGVWGGVIADRFDKRRILYFTQSIAGLLALLLGLLVVSHHIELWMVYVLAASLGFTQVVDNPSRQTFVMEMVGPANLKNAVTLNSTLVNVARVVGPSIAGALIATVGVGECFLINAASFGAVLIALNLMRGSELHPAHTVAKEPGQVKAGLQYVLAHPRLRSTLLMMFIIGTFAYEFPVILPLFATITLHGSATTYSAMTAAMGLGAVVGGLYTAGRDVASQRELVVVAILFGLGLFAIALSPGRLVAYLIMIIVGALSVLFISMGNATLQLTSEPQMRGRVMAMWSIAFLGTTPIGGPIIGSIADHSNPRVGLAVGGLATLVAAYLGIVSGRQ
ncbi:MAG TPA: MFS transporter [Verrucomicrobiae bacterium]|nr:MFS transporter [Verrucomicrobiae bacterium]